MRRRKTIFAVTQILFTMFSTACTPDFESGFDVAQSDPKKENVYADTNDSAMNVFSGWSDFPVVFLCGIENI
jgi:hypothetical protein